MTVVAQHPPQAAAEATGTAAGSAAGTAPLARHVAAALLLAAAALKWNQAYALADFGGFGWHHKPGTILLIGGEVLFAMLLVVGVAPRLTKWVAIAVFTLFAGYNGWRWLSGYATCGCFGNVSIHPAVTMLVDLAVVALFLLSPTAPLSSLDRRVHRGLLILAAGAAALVAIPAMATLATVSPKLLTADGLAGGDRGAIRLEPNQWVGKRLPLTPYIDGDPGVARGEWQIVLWHPGCGHCQTALPDIITTARETGYNTVLLNVTTEDEGDPLRAAASEVPNLHAKRLDPARH